MSVDHNLRTREHPVTPRRDIHVLVEGLDGVGKTSVVRVCVQQLRERGVPASRAGWCRSRIPSPSGLIDAAVGYRIGPTVLVADIVAGCAVLLDAAFSSLETNSHRNVYLHDGHIGRYFALRGAMIRQHRGVAISTFKRLSPGYDLAVLLTCDEQERAFRLSGRGIRNWRDQWLANHPQAVPTYADDLQSIVRSHIRSTTINTTGREVDSVARQLLGTITSLVPPTER